MVEKTTYVADDGKTYTSKDEAIAADKKFAESKKQELTLKNERAADAKKIDDAKHALYAVEDTASKNRQAAYDKYNAAVKTARDQLDADLKAAYEPVKKAREDKDKAVKAFCDKYGGYHRTYTGDEAIREAKEWNSLWDDLFTPLAPLTWLF